MVLVFKIREGIVGFVVLDSISWQSSSGCFHLCIGTLSLLSPRANFLSLLETAEGHRPFPPFFLIVVKPIKYTILLLSFLLGYLVVGLGRPSP